MFDNVTRQDKDAAKTMAEHSNKLANKQFKADEKRANRAEKREIIREKKQNQEGIYKKIGPFTIKTYLIIAAIIARACPNICVNARIS